MAITYSDYSNAIHRMAKRAGVSAKEVEVAYRNSLKRSSASAAGLFLLSGVITLGAKNSEYQSSQNRRAARLSARSR